MYTLSCRQRWITGTGVRCQRALHHTCPAGRCNARTYKRESSCFVRLHQLDTAFSLSSFSLLGLLPPPRQESGVAYIVMSVSTCVLVCPRTHVGNHCFGLQQIVYASYPWPRWLSLPLAALRYDIYFCFMDNVMLA